ncbi:MAG: di-trans,poly-cis-decaprenylcistransferase [Thermoplasmata archaeon]|nr:di-trans,poly-cis-decaprenylcistransferase [Thermoplasmata archaeon]
MAQKISGLIADRAYSEYEKRLIKEVQNGKPPGHVAIIMDGNRRFAKELGLETTDGHMKGRGKLEEVLNWCLETNVRILTVYAFSTENLMRDSEEVAELMRIFEESFYKVAGDDRIYENKIKIRVLGDTDLLPEKVQKAINHAEEKTKDHDQYFFNLAIMYGGRQEIIMAIRKIAESVKSGELAPSDIDEKIFANYLYTADLPDPDLVLRTSGEERISNFLLWQLAYSELYFMDVYWPGFRKIDFLRAIREYQRRARRYGK